MDQIEFAEIDISTKGHPGTKCLVDKPMLAELSGYRWGVAYMGQEGHKLPYARTRVGGRANAKFIRMHRLIMQAPDGVEVDHINGNTLDNRKANLRFSDRFGQMRNTKLKQTNTSGYKGVSFMPNKGKYRATITFNRKSFYLGLFTDPREAAEAYDTAAQRLYGEFARTNKSPSLRPGMGGRSFCHRAGQGAKATDETRGRAGAGIQANGARGGICDGF